MTQSLGPVSLSALCGGGQGGAIQAFRTKEEEDLKALRAAAVTKVVNEIQTVEDALRNMARVAAEVVSGDSTLAGSAKLLAINRAVAAAVGRLVDLEQRVVTVEEYFRDFRKALLTEIKKEYINVPAPKNEAPRHMAIQPYDLGDVKKRRRNTSVATTAAGNKKSAGADKQTRHKRKRKGIDKAAVAAAAAKTEKKKRAPRVKKEPTEKKPKSKKGKTIIKSEPAWQGGQGGAGSSEPMLPLSFTQIKWEDEEPI